MVSRSPGSYPRYGRKHLRHTIGLTCPRRTLGKAPNPVNTLSCPATLPKGPANSNCRTGFFGVKFGMPKKCNSSVTR